MFPEYHEDWERSVFSERLPLPDVDPDEGQMELIRVNAKWIPYILGALQTLSHSDAWDTTDPDELLLTQYRVNNLLDLFVNPIEEPPFYDDDETADDVQLPAEPWYESIADWVITAFLATTFTPGAAIVYQTTIPRLRLAFRTGDLGAIAKVLLNDLEIWTGNTSTPAIGSLSQILDLEAFADTNGLGAPPWTLRIEHAGSSLGFRQSVGEETGVKLEVELGDVRPRVDAMEFRQNGCVLEVTTNGVDWVPLYDPTDCIDPLVDGAIQDAINSGELSNNHPYSGPQSPPEAGQCRTYHVILSGKEQWLCPSPVAAGDTIHIHNAVGGASDGSLAWYCPDGSRFLLGACSPDLHTHVDGDPLNPGAYHMALIGNVNSVYFDPLNTTYTVPGGTASGPLLIQPNDASLSDNQGGYEFDVDVCTGVGIWTATFDFTTGEHGWERAYWSSAYRAVYSAGNGYGFGTGGYCEIWQQPSIKPYLTTVEVWRTFRPDNGRNHFDYGTRANTGNRTIERYNTDTYDMDGSLYHCVFTINHQMPTTAVVLAVMGDKATPSGYITKVVVHGTGPNPYA